MFSTTIAKISLADVPALSVAIALTFKFPTLSLVGVPLKVRVAELKVNQLGKALPFSKSVRVELGTQPHPSAVPSSLKVRVTLTEELVSPVRVTITSVIALPVSSTIYSVALKLSYLQELDLWGSDLISDTWEVGKLRSDLILDK